MILQTPSEPPTFINLSERIPSSFIKTMYQLIAPMLEKFIGVEYINQLYALHYHSVSAYCASPVPAYFDYLLDVLEAQVQYDPTQLERIPQTGAVIIAANHPFGALDGIAMSSLVIKRRHDMRLMSNHFLELIPGLKPWLCSVDPFETPDAKKLNLSGMKLAYRWLNHGGCIATFPSGSVSHWTFKNRRIEDPDWHANLARLARKTNASVVPMFFEGHNSWLFQMAGYIHPLCRTALLGRELKLHDTPIKVIIGEPISPSLFSVHPSDRELSTFIRGKCYELERPSHHNPRLRPPPSKGA